MGVNWFDLREHADIRSRDRGLMEACGALFQDHKTIRITDLACNNGASARALYGYLPARQIWRMVDHDEACLALAKQRLITWADEMEPYGDDLRLVKDNKTLFISFEQISLDIDLDKALGTKPDLVTASTLLHLVSAAWAGQLATSLGQRQSVFYAALSYDGIQNWEPAHPLDEPVLSALATHQIRDKGFGPALSGNGTTQMAFALSDLDYDLRIGASPWHLDQNNDANLIKTLITGIAASVRETGLVSDADLESWLSLRQMSDYALIGHMDLLASPYVQGQG